MQQLVCNFLLLLLLRPDTTGWPVVSGGCQVSPDDVKIVRLRPQTGNGKVLLK